VTFAGADESALFHRLDGIAIGRQMTYFFIIFQPPQNWVAAERISFSWYPSLMCESRSCSVSVSFGARSAVFFFAILSSSDAMIYDPARNFVVSRAGKV
jgi:hypothetical protein